jgi:hypothetical protein
MELPVSRRFLFSIADDDVLLPIPLLRSRITLLGWGT